MIRCAVVYEGQADFRTATELADRILAESAEWIGDDALDFYRTWIGASPEGDRLTWTGIARLALRRGIRVRGFMGGEPARSDQRAARRALLLVEELFDQVDAVLLIRDLDDDSDRREGLLREKQGYAGNVRIILGMADPKRECWVLSGFAPDGPEENARLEMVRRQLGFDPTRQSEHLTAKPIDATRSAKRVLNALTLSDSNREAMCWRQPSVELLMANGSNNGLAAFLEQVRDELAPLARGE